MEIKIMGIISYAQNFEDVILWRALKHIKNGCYVDVGAWHPKIHSVSKAFYENGWRGIHIEPVPKYAELLRKDRPDEIVLEVAISDIEGELTLNVVENTGISTVDDSIAQNNLKQHGYDFKRIKVPALTLNSALKFLNGKDVHWMKIDVEGLEGKILKGWKSKNFRPWIIVIEAVIPLSSMLNHSIWESILTDANYQFVYFDGLNRFYIAKEHIELVKAFTCPPNIFDEFVNINTVESMTERDALEKRLQSLLNSYSYRVTAPLRLIKHGLNLIKEKLKKK
jgi:FkbM family methyltransferase